MAALKYWVWFTTLPGLTNRSKLLLLEHFPSPEDIYYAQPEDLPPVEGLSSSQAALLSDKSTDRAEDVLAHCAKGDIFLLTMQDALYPDRLRNIYDPPVLLYGRGRMPLFDEEAAVSVVGTRTCTPYGISAAEELGYQLAKEGAVVVSGLAKGIDGASHRGALRAGGFTAAVLGGGVDVVYPAENRRLYEDIAATGVLLSEYPPGTEPMGSHFPVRNRILSGLSLAVLVVEAPERSGALITANTALEQGRDVFAVPGPIDAPQQPGQQPPHPGRRRTCDLRLGHSGGVPEPVPPPAAPLVGESSSGAGAGQSPPLKGRRNRPRRSRRRRKLPPPCRYWT